MMLSCEKYRQMAKGSVADRLAVAMSTLPDACASELFLILSKDSIPDVRAKVASNQSIPKDSVCRVLGRLHKDKATYVRNSVRDNIRFNTECDGEYEMNYTTEQWYSFDVKRADARCHGGCNYPRLIGELEAQDVAVVSVLDWKNEDVNTLHDYGFDYVPAKVSWQIDLSKYHSFAEYLQSIEKGDYVDRRKRRLQKDNITFVEMPLSSSKYYNQWYEIYKNTMESKERGRIIVKENSPPEHLTAIYALKDDTVLGGILYNKRLDVVSAAYGAFLRHPVGLTDVALAELIENAIKTGKKRFTLGMDTNFYGYHLKTGLYSFKTSNGYTPHEFMGKNFFKVIDDKKFDNPYMYLSFSHFNDPGLRNNIFIKGDKKVSLDVFNAPEGVRIHHEGKTFSHYPEKDEYYQDGKIGVEGGGSSV